jgi:hypothetical protein
MAATNRHLRHQPREPATTATIATNFPLMRATRRPTESAQVRMSARSKTSH